MADTSFNFKLWVKDTEERALSTLVQALIVFLPAFLAGQHDSNFIKTVAAAVITAVFTVMLSAAQAFTPIIKSYSLDLFVRALKTFSVVVAGAATSSGFDLFDVSKLKAIVVAALVTVAALIKGVLAEHFVKNTITPASLMKAA